VAETSGDVRPRGNDGRPLKAAALAADELRRRIATGELAPGDRLPSEDGLMAEFDLARTTLREALRILESEGLITVQRGRRGGPRVTRPPIDNLARGLALHLQMEGTTLRDLDTARQVIEPVLAANMASSCTEEGLNALEEAIAGAGAAARAGDRAAFGRAAAAVHGALYVHGGNTTLSVIARTLHEVTEAYYRLAAEQASDQQLARAVQSYRRLRRYIEDGEAAAAAEHWREQLASTASGLSRRLNGDTKLEVFTRTATVT
jgi:DNA-binding FadR family transcriptional regulator